MNQPAKICSRCIFLFTVKLLKHCPKLLSGKLHGLTDTDSIPERLIVLANISFMNKSPCAGQNNSAVITVSLEILLSFS